MNVTYLCMIRFFEDQDSKKTRTLCSAAIKYTDCCSSFA